MQSAPLLDKLLFNTFKQAFGGRVRFIVSGGAPLASHVEDFLAVTLCAPVFQVSSEFHASITDLIKLELFLAQGLPYAFRSAGNIIGE